MRVFDATVVLAFLSSAFLAGASKAEVLATCGASSGKTYYENPGPPRWVDDTVKSGRLTFLADDASGFNIIIKDATGVTFDLKSDGATIIANGLDAERGAFTFTAVYKKTPVVEVYQVFTTEKGKRRLVWISSKNGLFDGKLTKSSIFIAECD